GTIIGAILDITEERRMLATMRDSADRLKLAEQTAGFGVYEVDHRTGLATISEGAARLNGLTGDRLQLPIRELFANVHPEDQQRSLATRGRALAKGGEYQHEFRILRADGTVRWCRSR